MAAAPPAGKPDYGLDAPVVVKRMFTRGAWALAVGLGLCASSTATSIRTGARC